MTVGAPPGTPLLRIEAVTVRFGGIVALDGVSLDVAAGTICGLIGPNGAGKSTLFNCLSRLYDCSSGRIEFAGQALNRLPRHRMAALGIGRTFQNLALFATMSVRDNVLVGTGVHHGSGFLRDALRLPGVARRDAAAAERVESLLDLLELQPVADRRVSELPFGTQKRVELARALAAEPKLLLLDEPACGLNHEELAGLGDLILSLRARLGLTVLLVEHHMGLVMRVSDRVVALNFGRRIAEGTPAEVRSDPEVIRAYLGDTPAADAGADRALAAPPAGALAGPLTGSPATSLAGSPAASLTGSPAASPAGPLAGSPPRAHAGRHGTPVA